MSSPLADLLHPPPPLFPTAYTHSLVLLSRRVLQRALLALGVATACRTALRLFRLPAMRRRFDVAAVDAADLLRRLRVDERDNVGAPGPWRSSESLVQYLAVRRQ